MILTNSLPLWNETALPYQGGTTGGSYYVHLHAELVLQANLFKMV